MAENIKENESESAADTNPSPGESISIENIKRKVEPVLLDANDFVSKINNETQKFDIEFTVEHKNKLKEIAGDLRQSIEDWHTLSKAIQEAESYWVKDIELEPKDKKKLLTAYDDKRESENQKNTEILETKMRNALLISQEIMSEAEYPNFCFGSVVGVIEYGDKIGRKPKDSDRVACIKDFSKAYAKAKILASKNEIANINLIEMKNPKGEENKCFELKIQTLDSVEVSIFFQNADETKPRNGRINVGLEQTNVNYYEIDGVQIPFADSMTNDKMYARSALYEIGLFDSKIYKERKGTFPYIDAKALKRFVDLMVIHDFNFNKVIEIIKSSIDENSEDELKDAVLVVEWLEQEWKNKKFKNEGLVAQMCNQEIPHCEEVAIDQLASEIKDDIEAAYKMWQDAEEAYVEGSLEKIREIEKKIAPLYDKYENKKRLLNSSHQIDAVAYIGIRSIEHNFLFKIILDLDYKKNKLKNKNQ